jgi:hypothetical protein
MSPVADTPRARLQYRFPRASNAGDGYVPATLRCPCRISATLPFVLQISPLVLTHEHPRTTLSREADKNWIRALPSRSGLSCEY